MEIAANHFALAVLGFARKLTEPGWMEFKFLPPVAIIAGKTVGTAVVVVDQMILYVPVLALLWNQVFVKGTLEVLPVVRVYASELFMRQSKRTELRFELEEEEVYIKREQMNRLRPQFPIRMSIGAN